MAREIVCWIRRERWRGTVDKEAEEVERKEVELFFKKWGERRATHAEQLEHNRAREMWKSISNQRYCAIATDYLVLQMNRQRLDRESCPFFPLPGISWRRCWIWNSPWQILSLWWNTHARPTSLSVWCYSPTMTFYESLSNHFFLFTSSCLLHHKRNAPNSK